MRRWIVVAALVAACAACGNRGDKDKGGGADPKVRIAQLQVSKLAFSAYAQWLSVQGGKQCPDSLKDLTPYMTDDSTLDPWGQAYQMTCVRARSGTGSELRVMSTGPDGKMGTDDDIDSSKIKPGD